MKKVSLLIITLIFSVCNLLAQNEFVSFEESMYDFGQIGEKDGKVSHDFVFTNKSKEVISVTQVKASCGCTTPKWTKEPIGPGEKGTISATYNPSGRPGAFNKSITVTFSHGGTERINIRGVVEREPMKIEDQYPYKFGNFRMKKAEMEFGIISHNEKKTIILDIYNEGEAEASPKFSSLPAGMTYVLKPEKIAPKKTGKVEFTINTASMKNLKYGKSTDEITIGSKEKITYSLDVRDSFKDMSNEDKRKAGRIHLNDNQLTFDAKTNTAIIKVSNSGSSDLHIKMIQSDSPGMSFSKTNLTVKPESIQEVKVKFSVNKLKDGERASSIYIYSDDPYNSVKEVKVIVKR